MAGLDDSDARRPRIAVATSESLPGLDPDSVPLLHALRRTGAAADPVVWSERAVDWAAFDAVLVRSTWDYFNRLEEFLAWIASVPVPLVNAAPVLAWNAHKSYLDDLAGEGVPTVDTLWVRAGERATVPWPDAILKPAVAGSAQGLRRVRAGETVAAAVDLMIQPFLPSIEDEGELSLLYAGGVLSHAVRKLPRPGDIRVQPEWGGSSALEYASDEARAVGAAALAAAGPVASARVDLVRAPDGTLRLIELELIEPNLFLTLVPPQAADRFARAMLSAACAPRA